MNTVRNDGIIRVNGFLNSPQLLLTNPRALADVLVSKPYDFQKPETLRNVLRLALGEGLISAEGEMHRHLRKRILPTLNFRHIKDLTPIFWRESTKATRKILTSGLNRSQDSQSPQHLSDVTDIEHWSMGVTLGGIGIAALGEDFNTLKHDKAALLRTYSTIFKPSWGMYVWFAASIILPRWLVKCLLWSIDQKITSMTHTLTQICRRLIQDKRKATTESREELPDMISRLISTSDLLDQDLVDQLLTFLAAG